MTEKAARSSQLPGPALPGRLGLQRAVGNAAVVQMLRQSGHSWAQPEQHQHTAGCGHRGDSPALQRAAAYDMTSSSLSLPRRTAAPVESGGPVGHAIQRRVSVRNEQDPQNTRALRDEQSVRGFLDQYKVSILATVASDMGASFTPQAAGHVGFKSSNVIAGLIADAEDRVYDDSSAGAHQLAKVISDEIITLLASSGPQARSTLSAPSGMPRHMSQGQSVGSGAGASSGAAKHGLNSVLAQLAQQKMAQHTPDSPFTSGLQQGVQSAVTGRVAAITDPLPSSESVSEGMRWAAWVALEGESKVRQAVEQAAKQVSPEEGQRLMSQFDRTLAAKQEEMAGSVIGSLATGGLIGQAANAIPHTGVKVAAKIGSTLLGGLAAAKKFGDGAEAVKTIEAVSPQTYQTMLKARDRALDQAAEQFMVKSREHTMDALRDSGNF